MSTISVNENLTKVPELLQRELCEFLKDEERFGQLAEMLQGAGLILEKDGFQIPIHSVEELDAIRKYLSGS